MTWRVQFVCCGRDAGQQDFSTWTEADAFRESYCTGVGVATPTNTNGHDRAGIITRAGKGDG